MESWGSRGVIPNQQHQPPWGLVRNTKSPTLPRPAESVSGVGQPPENNKPSGGLTLARV